MLNQIKELKAIVVLASVSATVGLIMWYFGIYVFLLSVGMHIVNWPLTISLWLVLSLVLSYVLKLALVKS